jgi:hyperosmotically inducible periplasmic protein
LPEELFNPFLGSFMKKNILLIPALCLLAFGCSRNNVNIAPPSAPSDQSQTDDQNSMDQSTDQMQSSVDQAMSADQQITQSINSAIMNDSTLSSSAKSVQVTSSNGNVSLQGMVKSRQEKNKLVAMAKATPGVSSVDATMLVVQP